ncbi:RsmB/NOP family class I SAM-dependent RNA methyltransferase [Citricoccus muralis]|uniref:Transcription antitermination factor NusB n=1 Tax=Citricoccus muralis TaxID=169134 RepID=A0ABY8H298_9MICC|nr:transcription antitermination factor NusB [Citricoccus muralis]WFP15249.1 transcription antitermination factor NusB [Citricoccus muralis]
MSQSPRQGQSGRPDRRNRSGGDQQRRNAQGRTRNRGTSGGPRQFSANAPSQRRRTADPSRLVAFEVMRAVARDDAYANLVLPHRIRQHRLDHRDAGFATELTYGALRLQGTYDAILTECVDRPLKDLDVDVLVALRLGGHQLLSMRVPAHAALDSTVALVRSEIGAGPSGLVNAVLRKVSAKDLDTWLAEVAPGDTDDAVAVRSAHPRWIVRALRQALVSHGRPADELADLLAANNTAPIVNLVSLPGLGDLEPVLEQGAQPGPLAPDSALYRGGDAARLPGVKEGTVRVQDVGSQLTARALVATPRAAGSPETEATREGEVWLDLCAGPGGKAALLAALAAEQGATLVANEVAPHRARLVENALAPVPHDSWTVRTGEGQSIGADYPDGFDRILLDAPCTGLGALRRRPESRWRRQPSDLPTLTSLQRELLEAAVGALRPGGVLAYVTCSPHQAETMLQVHDVRRRHPDLELLDSQATLAGVAVTTEDGESTLALELLGARPETGTGTTAQLWPHLHATDAMFLALFRKAPTSADDLEDPSDG